MSHYSSNAINRKPMIQALFLFIGYKFTAKSEGSQ